MALLVKYWKSQGYSKKQVKEWCIDKCVKYVKNFNPIKDGPDLKKSIDKVWRDWKTKRDNPSKLREIDYVEFSKEVLDWFLGLEDNFIITDEERKRINELRAPTKVKRTPMNFNRIKVLFTLYIWSLIQKEYMAGGWNYFNLDDWYPKLKKDSDLPTSYNILNERNILEDLGFLKTTEKNVDVILELFDKFDVFNIEVADKNRIRLEGEDLYNCGLWLKKQKFDWFICEECGRVVFEIKSHLGPKRRYCKKCALKLKNEAALRPKFCVDCGKELEIKANMKIRRYRCPECQEKRRREMEHERYERKKLDFTIIPQNNPINSNPANP